MKTAAALIAVWILVGGQFIVPRPPSSGSCVFPSCFPDASNTGVPAGTSLTAYSGANPITVDGTTVDSKIITNCPLVVQAINVTIKNSQLNCTDAGALYVDDAAMYTRTSNGTSYAVLVQDSDITCGAVTVGNTAGVQESYVDLLRVEITGCENGGSVNQKVRFRDSFIHKLAAVPPDPHEDGIQMSQGHWTGAAYVCTGGGCSINILVDHSTIFGQTGSSDANPGTSAIITNHDGNLDSLTVQNSLLAGAGTTIYCNRPDAGNNVLTNNHWSTQFYATVGSIEATEDCADETLSGNVYHETGLPITLGAPTPEALLRWLKVPSRNGTLQARRF